ncbi:bifunctional DNA-binding transcriptional regulator/O6-methylguanine-DNA methyltransferase Ada [Marinobacter mobilis]|uniref:AraC family transcriptional regulator, regulatory protein of adaptative response / methylated-DNA-[protein]-cysteine methyltransferase n=1 Tax=Marinobacter mobilis TaxID=488533 RepID=A0A1H3CF26_9GAMM|nr:bifunctional DNA-binding transcriptional regulator/O6-methylguanine-DNA methyltransferase Ada [Marinobacter mobilis]SDW75566.1 AraC family transcriptional regulator, regulatory protein of adaptative response / methylated-DNA-[protein]-cysteine methyltransferase [Marinobacter mobilis]SDX52716.1 AraC family transcriptional regulator, regulatory protein of adaptative response / methylated-DNA-[protein]-cysteine methyltransferase [Marinobacter mobilis]
MVVSDVNTSEQRHRTLVAELCRRIEQAESAPTLAELAAQAGLSRYHLQRVFKAVTGISPAAYARRHRHQRLAQTLHQPLSVTEAAYAAGYASSSHFYREANEILGMNPKDYQRHGRNNTIRFAVGQCSLGAILVACSERGICAIALGEDPQALVEELQGQFRNAELVGGDRGFEQQIAAVVGLVEQPQLGLTLPLDIRGTAFQQRVWQALRAIPPGQTVSYSDIARRIGSPAAVRAVAGACAANRLAVAIPCHRVVRSDGGLSGYRWGIARKRALLERERG